MQPPESAVPDITAARGEFCLPDEHDWRESLPATVGGTPVWACSKCPIWSTKLIDPASTVPRYSSPHSLKEARALARRVYGTVERSTADA